MTAPACANIVGDDSVTGAGIFEIGDQINLSARRTTSSGVNIHEYLPIEQRRSRNAIFHKPQLKFKLCLLHKGFYQRLIEYDSANIVRLP